MNRELLSRNSYMTIRTKVDEIFCTNFYIINLKQKQANYTDPSIHTHITKFQQSNWMWYLNQLLTDKLFNKKIESKATTQNESNHMSKWEVNHTIQNSLHITCHSSLISIKLYNKHRYTTLINKLGWIIKIIIMLKMKHYICYIFHNDVNSQCSTP